jgi:KDO2-lipid IV(A) lauroyltransferase
MQLLTFMLVYPIIWIFARLPFKILYLISDILFFIIYRIIRYRRKVVTSNLEKVFQNKNKIEIARLAKKHYRHFTDLFIEMLKTWSMSKEDINKHFKYRNISILNELYDEGKSIILVCGHYGNWEWSGNMESFMKHKGHAVYKPMKNKYFDHLIYKIRAKFGATPIDKNKIIKTFITNEKNKIPGLYLMVADQSPKLQHTRFWSKFLGVKVPVFVGSEILAKKMDAAVVFFDIKKVKRGFYEATFNVLSKNPKELQNYKITELFLRELECQIFTEPAYYFWTHKRFKHVNKSPV